MFVKKNPIEEAFINAYLEEWVLTSDTPSEGPNAIEAPNVTKNRSQRSHQEDAQDIGSKEKKKNKVEEE